jgi:hypothetical protein
MHQPVRFLVTGSRTWDDTAIIEHTLQERARGVPDRTVNRGESESLTGTPQGR